MRVAGTVGLVLAVMVALALVTRASPPDPGVADAEQRFSALLGVPVTVRIADTLVVEATHVPLEGSTAILQTLRLELDRPSNLGEPDKPIATAGGSFIAELDDDAVQQLIGVIGRLPLTDVELRGGFARFVLAGFPVVDVTAHVDGGTVAFRPRTPLVGERLGLALELDGLPLRLHPVDAQIRRGVLRLSGSAPRLRLPAAD